MSRQILLLSIYMNALLRKSIADICFDFVFVLTTFTGKATIMSSSNMEEG